MFLMDYSVSKYQCQKAWSCKTFRDGAVMFFIVESSILRHDILIVVYVFVNLKLKTMQRKLLGLLFAAAAYGYYKYSRMTPEEKQDLKRKGGDLLKNLGGIGNNKMQQPATVSTENNY